MKQIDKRLIVSDFDGTLLTSSQTIPDGVRVAISEYVQCGGVFAVCTGRMLSSILPQVRKLGLKGLVVAYQGTVIAEIESGKIIKKGCLKCEEVTEICRYIEGLNHSINVYHDEVLYTDIPKDNPHLKTYEEITGITARHVKIPVSRFVKDNGYDCQKIACLVAPKEREALYRSLLKKFGERFDVTCSAEVLVEVSPLNDNKGEALKYIANYFGIPLESTVAVGDNLNDLPMVQAAQIGVAVGNAVQSLKDAADFVAVTNDDGAVAEVIKKFGFKS